MLAVAFTFLVTSNAFSPPVHSNVNLANGPFSSSALRATWSNGQAIKEYNDFLSSGRSTPEELEDGPSVIITKDPSSPSPSAQALLRMGMGDDVVLAPGDVLPEHLGSDTERTSYPVYLCLEPCELKKEVTDHLFESWYDRQDDLVFVSPVKGNVEPTLKEFGLPRDTTNQLLIGFTTPSQKAFVPLDDSVDMGREDAQGQSLVAFESAACGKWKDAVVARLERNNVRCRAAFYRDWRRDMWERSIFDAVLHLVGTCAAVVSDADTITVAETAEAHGDDVSEMAWQLSSMLRGSNAIALAYGFEERMFTYARERGANMPCVLNDDDWNFVNGVFSETSSKGLSMGFGDPAPLHTEYVRYAAENGLLSENIVDGLKEILSSSDVEQRPSIMRQGNLRADGVI